MWRANCGQDRRSCWGSAFHSLHSSPRSLIFILTIHGGDEVNQTYEEPLSSDMVIVHMRLFGWGLERISRITQVLPHARWREQWVGCWQFVVLIRRQWQRQQLSIFTQSSMLVLQGWADPGPRCGLQILHFTLSMAAGLSSSSFPQGLISSLRQGKLLYKNTTLLSWSVLWPCFFG